MVVDDEVGVHELVRGALLDAETVVVGARNSREALDLLEDLPCDLLLVDSILPVSREQVLVAMKPGEQFQKKHPDMFLKKPFSKEQLVDFVVNYIG